MESQQYSHTIYDHPHILYETVHDLKRLRRSRPSLVLGESVQPLKNCLDLVLSEKLLHKFLCIPLSQAIQLSKDGLTWSSLPDLFCRKREGGE